MESVQPFWMISYGNLGSQQNVNTHVLTYCQHWVHANSPSYVTFTEIMNTVLSWVFLGFSTGWFIHIIPRDPSGYRVNQWETMLQYNVVFHWPCLCPEQSMIRGQFNWVWTITWLRKSMQLVWSISVWPSTKLSTVSISKTRQRKTRCCIFDINGIKCFTARQVNLSPYVTSVPCHKNIFMFNSRKYIFT